MTGLDVRNVIHSIIKSVVGAQTEGSSYVENAGDSAS